MYYEERMINGLLHIRTTPNGEWRLPVQGKAKIVNDLLQLSDEQRKEVFEHFCTHCGDINPPGGCVCMKDE